MISSDYLASKPENFITVSPRIGSRDSVVYLIYVELAGCIGDACAYNDISSLWYFRGYGAKWGCSSCGQGSYGTCW
jgi:hypothetical protein